MLQNTCTLCTHAAHAHTLNNVAEHTGTSSPPCWTKSMISLSADCLFTSRIFRLYRTPFVSIVSDCITVWKCWSHHVSHNSLSQLILWVVNVQHILTRPCSRLQFYRHRAQFIEGQKSFRRMITEEGVRPLDQEDFRISSLYAHTLLPRLLLNLFPELWKRVFLSQLIWIHKFIVWFFVEEAKYSKFLWNSWCFIHRFIFLVWRWKSMHWPTLLSWKRSWKPARSPCFACIRKQKYKFLNWMLTFATAIVLNSSNLASMSVWTKWLGNYFVCKQAKI